MTILYDGDHGRYVLQNSPGIGDMKMLSFVKVMYDITDNVMKIPDESRMQDFISISGSKMRLLARNGASPCSPTNIPTDLVEANCIPSGFMVPKGWKGVVDYYSTWTRRNDGRRGRSLTSKHRATVAPVQKAVALAPRRFTCTASDYDSFWHDIPLRPSNDDETIIHLVTEIPMFMTAKMEVQKEKSGNPISQDTNDDGSLRYYTYGTPFFNYGLLPQTWEDPESSRLHGYGGDNDPLDVIELGSGPLLMGSITPCRVLGGLELIDEGETDHKILCIALTDKDASAIFTLDDLERIKPGHVDRLRDWLKRYKTSDGKSENRLASETPKTQAQALQVIEETHSRWLSLCGKDGTSLMSLSSKAADFWLNSPGCRGE